MKLSKKVELKFKLPVELDPDQISSVWIRNFTYGDIVKISDYALEKELVFDPEKLAELGPDATDSEKSACMITKSKIDQSAFNHKTTELRITKWEGFVDSDGLPLSCTPLNKHAFADEQGFFTWLQQMATLVDKYAAGLLGDEEKNLLRSLGALQESENTPEAAKRARKS